MRVESGRQPLIRLAEKLNARGWASQIVTPPGRTVLRVLHPEGVALSPEHIVCDSGPDDPGWYRWRRTGARIAPVDQPEVAAKEVVRTLTPKGKP